VALGRSERERLLDQQRLVDEVRLGREQRQLEAVPGELAQRQQRLQAGDAAAGDQDSGLWTSLAQCLASSQLRQNVGGYDRKRRASPRSRTRANPASCYR